MRNIIGIKKMIEEDQLKEALNELILISSTSLENELLQHKGRLSRIEKDERLGLVDPTANNIKRNNIRMSLLNLINQIEVNDDRSTSTKIFSKKLRISDKNISLYWVILGILILLAVLFLGTHKQNIGIKGDNNYDNEVFIKN